MSAIITVIALAIIIFVCWKQNQSQSQTVEELRKTISEQQTTIYNLTTELNNVKAELSKMKSPAATVTESVVNEVVSRILQSKVFTDAKVLREAQQKVLDSLTADVAKGKETIMQITEAQKKAIASVAAEVAKVKDAIQQVHSKFSDAVVDVVIEKIKARMKKSDKNDDAEKIQEDTPIEEPEKDPEENFDNPEVKDNKPDKIGGKHKIIGGIIHGTKELFKKR